MSRTRYRRPFWLVLGSLCLVLLVGGGSAIVSLARLSTRHESACRKCHPLIYELWKESKGHPAQETSCFACHAGAHLVVPGGFLADDDVTDQRCLDCHEDVLDLGYTVKKKVIQFTHRIHIHEGIKCVDCHRAAGHEYMEGGTNRPTIYECQDCHMREFQGPPQNQKCLNCHEVLLTPGRGRD